MRPQLIGFRGPGPVVQRDDHLPMVEFPESPVVGPVSDTARTQYQISILVIVSLFPGRVQDGPVLPLGVDGAAFMLDLAIDYLVQVTPAIVTVEFGVPDDHVSRRTGREILHE